MPVLALEARSDDGRQPATPPSDPTPGRVVHGPNWYRRQIRRWGPLLACVLPAVLGGLAVLVRTVLEGKARGWTSLVLTVCAAPGYLAAGGVLATTREQTIGIVASVAVWLIVGFAASRVATRNPVATFSDFWRANWWLTAAVFAGAGLAIAVAVARGIQLR